MVAYVDDVAVGCGAVRRLDHTTGELKPMYVDPAMRPDTSLCLGKSLASGS